MEKSTHEIVLNMRLPICKGNYYLHDKSTITRTHRYLLNGIFKSFTSNSADKKDCKLQLENAHSFRFHHGM